MQWSVSDREVFRVTVECAFELQENEFCRQTCCIDADFVGTRMVFEVLLFIGCACYVTFAFEWCYVQRTSLVDGHRNAYGFDKLQYFLSSTQQCIAVLCFIHAELCMSKFMSTGIIEQKGVTENLEYCSLE